jgi:quercetin dioxygenase-like cupin family protein
MRTGGGFACVASLAIATVLLLSAGEAFAQPSGAPCKPATQQFGDQLGCWIIGDVDLGQLTQEPLFWHLDVFPTSADAEATKGPGGTVIEAFAKVWLSTITGANWRATGGSQIAIIGPLPWLSNDRYTARYMETVTIPGHSTSVHRHNGPEAVYTLTGQICLETPDGMAIGHAGEGMIFAAPPGMAMRGTTVGSEIRRTLVLILSKASQPSFTPAPDWTPKGLCKP